MQKLLRINQNLYLFTQYKTDLWALLPSVMCIFSIAPSRSSRQYMWIYSIFISQQLCGDKQWVKAREAVRRNSFIGRTFSGSNSDWCKVTGWYPTCVSCLLTSVSLHWVWFMLDITLSILTFKNYLFKHTCTVVRCLRNKLPRLMTWVGTWTQISQSHSNTWVLLHMALSQRFKLGSNLKGIQLQPYALKMGETSAL